MKRLILSICLFISAAAFSQAIKNVGPEEFKKMIDAKKGELIDLRTDDEIKSKGMIKDSKQINFLATDAEEQIKKLDKNKTYLLYCAGGGRSSDAAEMMSKMGFKEVVNLQLGYDNWKKKGFEVVSRP